VSRIIPPRRDELIALQDEVTQRYIEFFESLASITSETSIVVEDTVNISEVAAAARFASRKEVEEIRSQLTFFKAFVISQCLPKTEWKGNWTENTLYKKGQQAIECGWLGIANNTTYDHITPQAYGTPITEFANDAAAAFTTETALTVNAVALGTRYAGSLYHGILQQIRFFAVTASTDYFYDFWLVDESGHYCPISSHVQFAVTGWHTIETAHLLIENQSQFDLLCIVTNHDSGSSTFNAPWNYSAQSGAPASGEMRHQNNGWELRINYTDDNAADQTANLQALVTGDEIDITGQQWRIVDVENTAGAFITLRITPARRVTNALYTVTFTQYTATNIDYPMIVNTYNGNADVDGFTATDSDGVPPSTDDNSYGLDLLFQPAQTSDQWDIQAFL